MSLVSHQREWTLRRALPYPPRVHEILSNAKRYNRQGHHLEKIVAENEPDVSGGLGSQVITHNDDDAM
jgi:hypothetical protein